MNALIVLDLSLLRLLALASAKSRHEITAFNFGGGSGIMNHEP